jgi:hypothetical protein
MRSERIVDRLVEAANLCRHALAWAGPSRE